MMRLLAEYEAAVRKAARTAVYYEEGLSSVFTMGDVIDRNNEVDKIREKFRAVVDPIGGKK